MNDNLKKRYVNLSLQGRVRAVDHYLKRLSKSINVAYDADSRGAHKVKHLTDRFRKGSGWRIPKEGYTWESRVKYWDKKGTMWFRDSTVCDSRQGLTDIPIFPTWFEHGITHAETGEKPKTDHIADSLTPVQRYMTATKPRQQGKTLASQTEGVHPHTVSGDWLTWENVAAKSSRFNTIYENKSNRPKKENKMRETINEVLDTNKEALKIGAKLSAGKTANSFFLNKVFGRFPWYAKLFGKKADFTENPLAKLATANMAKTLAAHFAQDNDKLNYLADAMVQDSMVTLTRDSAMLEGLIKELEGMVPEFAELKTDA